MTFYDHVKPLLDKKKHVAQERLDQIKADYDKGFAKVEKPRPDPAIPFGSLPTDPQPIETSVKTAEHRTIGGSGGAPEEAIADFMAKFDQLPKSGEMVFWRVAPEIDWYYDFERQETIWRVFARVAIFE